VVRSAIESHGDPRKEVYVLTVDDLAQAARSVLDRVDSVEVTAASNPVCAVDHLDIAQAGIEEGLELALRVLHQQFGSLQASDSARTVDDELREMPCPTPDVRHSLNGR
jgi:hypothetical protein